MKKKIITTLILSMSLGMVYTMPNNVKETKANTIQIIGSVTTEGLGYSINLVKDSYIDASCIKLDNPIFSTSWLGGQTKTRTVLNQTSSTINHANSIEKMIVELENDFNLTSSSQGDYSLFTATAATKFNDYSRVNYPDFVYQYFSTYNYKVKRYSYELDTSDLTNYKRNLSDEYIEDLEALLYEEITGTEFFDKYGTHVIAKATYGGNFEINYSAASNYYDVWRDYYDTLNNYLNTELYSKVPASTTIEFDPLLDLDMRAYDVYAKTQIRTFGGTDLSTLTADEISLNFSDWVTSVSSSPKIIETPSDGLIPLWDLLPSYYDTTEFRNIFMDAYNSYASSHESTLLNLYYPTILNEEYGVETGYTFVRAGEAIITDDGMFNQYYDVMDLNDDFTLKFDYMLEKGFTKVDIYLEMDLKEINMGYQIIAYYTSEKEDSTYEIGRIKLEHEGTALGTTYNSYCILKEQIPVTTFTSSDPDDYGKIVFRYSAEGSGEDDWVNKVIYTNIVYFK